MKNLFPVNELVNADPCDDGLDRVTRSLCTYSGLTVVTVDALEHANTSDILWGLKVLPISEHEQLLLAVKIAVYAAEQVAHLTNDPRAAACISAAKSWLDNPCAQTAAAAAEATRAAGTRAAEMAEMTRARATAMASMAAEMAAETAARARATARATARARAATARARAATARARAAAAAMAARAAAMADPTVAESIKSYAIQLIREA